MQRHHKQVQELCFVMVYIDAQSQVTSTSSCLRSSRLAEIPLLDV